jgi:hypothetical protein
MRRAGVVLTVFALGAIASGCASADHSWKGEFDARLEGAGASIEETLAAVGPTAPEREYFRRYPRLAPELHHNAELIEGRGACSEVYACRSKMTSASSPASSTKPKPARRSA